MVALQSNAHCIKRPSAAAVLQAAGADVALLASRLEVAQAELEGERAAHRREMRKKLREIQEVWRSSKLRVQQQQLDGSSRWSRSCRGAVMLLLQQLRSVCSDAALC